MWIFKSKPKPPPAKTRQQIETEEAMQQIEELRAWKPVGSKIVHLGRTMVVTAHGVRPILEAAQRGAPAIWPQLTLQYADNDGVIRNLEVAKPMSLALMRLDKERAAAPGATA